jgi:hypothetical protein
MGIDTDKAEIDNALAWAAKALHRECYGADEGTRREALREALTRTLAWARAEGFRAAKERAAALANDAFEEAKARRKACNLTAPMGQAMHRISEGQEDVLGTLSDDIRAMEDAGEGGANVVEPCARCGLARAEHDVMGRVQRGETDGVCEGFAPAREPPLSQLRAATERMEAATRAEVDGDLKPIRGFAMPPPGVLAAIRTRHANPGDASETSPTPAAMLGEIDDMLTRSRSLAVRLRGRVGDDAGALSLYLRALEDEVSRAQGDAARAKREAEAREGQG